MLFQNGTFLLSAELSRFAHFRFRCSSIRPRPFQINIVLNGSWRRWRFVSFIINYCTAVLQKSMQNVSRARLVSVHVKKGFATFSRKLFESQLSLKGLCEVQIADKWVDVGPSATATHATIRSVNARCSWPLFDLKFCEHLRMNARVSSATEGGPWLFAAFRQVFSGHLKPLSPAMSNPNGLLSQKLCHCLGQGRTLNDILLSAAHWMAYFDHSKLDLANVQKAFESKLQW